MSDTVKEVYIENKLDYGKFILEPKSGETWKGITKDFALSNLDPRKLMECEARQEIINIIMLDGCIQWLQKSFESFERDQQVILQLQRSKFGLQSKLERSNLTGDTTNQKSFEQDNKSKTIFSKQEGGR